MAANKPEWLKQLDRVDQAYYLGNSNTPQHVFPGGTIKLTDGEVIIRLAEKGELHQEILAEVKPRAVGNVVCECIGGKHAISFIPRKES